MKMFKRGVLGGAAVGALAVAGSASAAAIDVTAVTAFATDAGTAVGVIGLAILLVKYGKKVYTWLNP